MNTRDARRNAAFGAWLKGRLGSRNLNQAEFARKVGVSQGTVSKWLSGRLPKAEFIDPIADVLMLDYDVVATKAGYRPAADEIATDSKLAEALGMVQRIDWETDPTRIDLLRSVLQNWINQDAKEAAAVLADHPERSTK